MDIIQKSAAAIGIAVLAVFLVAGFAAAIAVGILLLPAVAVLITLWLILSTGNNWGGSRPSDKVSLKRMWRK